MRFPDNESLWASLLAGLLMMAFCVGAPASTVPGPKTHLTLGNEARSKCAAELIETLESTFDQWGASDGIAYAERAKHLGTLLESTGIETEVAHKAAQIVAEIMASPERYPVVRGMNRWLRSLEIELEPKHPEYQFVLCLLSPECKLFNAPQDNLLVTRMRPDRPFRHSPNIHRDRAYAFATPQERVFLLKYFPSEKQGLVKWVNELLASLALLSSFATYEHWHFAQVMLEESGNPMLGSLLPSLVHARDGRLLVDEDIDQLIYIFRRDLLAEAVYRKWFADDADEVRRRLRKLAKTAHLDIMRSGNPELIQISRKMGIKSASDYLRVAKQTLADIEAIVTEAGI